MSKTFHCLHVHLVWSTVGREPILSDEVQDWLWPTLAEKARELDGSRVVVGGMPDHVHILTEFTVTRSIADLVRHLKGASSRIAHLRGMPEFAWQEGYGAFAVSRSQLARVEAYVRRQPEHHGKLDIAPELEAMPRLVP